jgi:hypothetical protein
VLFWAEREGRVLVTVDWNTMPNHFANHLQQGHHSPGMFILRPSYTVTQLVSHLVLAAYALDPAELLDQIRYLP